MLAGLVLIKRWMLVLGTGLAVAVGAGAQAAPDGKARDEAPKAARAVKSAKAANKNPGKVVAAKPAKKLAVSTRQARAGFRKVSLKRDRDVDRALDRDPVPGGVPRLASSSALVLDQQTGEVLFEKNAGAVVPIASITKLMTAMVVLDAVPDLDEIITIGNEDIDLVKGSHSRLPVGTRLTRERALLLALMSSENRAAHALGRHYPGGLTAFVDAMNRKAEMLGMANSRFADPTGLSSINVSTAQDLARLVAGAHAYPVIRQLSTTPSALVEIGRRPLGFNNTNALVKSDGWEIGLSKTGYIQEAGKCLVMQAWVAGRPTVIVLLDSNGKLTRIGDANRVKRWLENGNTTAVRTLARAS